MITGNSVRFLAAALLAPAVLLLTANAIQALSQDQDAKFKVTGIYFFGTDVDNLEPIKSALPVHIGDEHRQAEQAKVQSSINDAVKKTLGKGATNVAVINCGNLQWNIYVGLPGRSVVTPPYNKPPQADLKLPKEASDLHAESGSLLQKVLKEKGGCREDDSKGYSLVDDPELRAVELKIRGWAIANDGIVRQVLKTSRYPEQRGTAAAFLGMEDPSRSEIQALVDAASDENSTVRNNATRALSCIARSDTPLASNIPRSKFIGMLNSGTWVDRNKGVFVVSALSRKDPHVIDRVRDEAFQGLCDMATWDSPHAGPARYMLFKISGLKDEKLGDDDVDKLVEAARVKYRRALLQDIFDADQSDWGRTKAYDCYQRLLAARPLFEGTKDEARWLYPLSFESFHTGQIEALDKKNPEKALQYLKQSLEHANASVKAWEKQNEPEMAKSNTEWSNYVRATIAYMENDKEKLAELKDKCGDNDRTIARLFPGLEKFNKPDYLRDYAGDDGSDQAYRTLHNIFSPLEHHQEGAALECYEKLAEVESQYKEAPHLNQTYYHWLSQAAFQSGLEELKKKNNADALQYLDKSLAGAQQECKIEEARKNKYGLTRASQRRDYILAIIAYQKNDIAQLQSVVGKCGANNKVVDCLADGLMTYDGPDFARDTKDAQL